MFSNIALDVFIGLVFIFLLYSLLATIIQEMIATRLAFRAKILEKAILRMLEDGKTTTWRPYGDRISGVLHLFGLKNLMQGKTVAPWFYAHPLIKYLSEDNYYSKPAYIDAQNFSKVMIDLLKGFNQPESQAVQNIHNSIAAGIIYKLPIDVSATAPDKNNPAIKALVEQYGSQSNSTAGPSGYVSLNINTALFLQSVWRDSGADINLFRQKLEQWFDDTMLRATGWYRRYTRMVLFIIGLAIAVVFNVDTIAIHRILSKDKTAREQLVNMAIKNQDKYGQMVGNGPASRLSDSILNDTYKMVSADAESANSILGLGRPWRDTCDLCDLKYGLQESDTTINKLLLEQTVSLSIMQHILDTMPKVSVPQAPGQAVTPANSNSSAPEPSGTDKMQQQTAKGKDSVPTAKDSTNKVNDTTHTTLEAKPDKTILELNDSIASAKAEITLLKTLKKRCPYIRKQTQTWFKYNDHQNGGFETILGWLITAMAVTLGAPFWFGMLSKLISLRGSGNKIDSSEDKDSPAAGSGTSATTTAPATTITVNNAGQEEAVG